MRGKFVIGALTLILAAWAFAAQSRDSDGSSRQRAYRVTPWPDHLPDNSYVEEVAEHLNRMAADGWRYHSETTGQGARMMIFERAESRRN